MEYSILIQKALEVVITVLLPVVLGYLVILLKSVGEKIKQQVGKEQWEVVSTLAGQFVSAAEQLGLKDEALAVGEAKKQWVLEQLQGELSRRKINIDVATLAALIEAVVYDELNWTKRK